MSISAIAGVLALNFWFLAVGVAVLFGLRGWRSWGELGRLAGLGYMLGVAAMGVVWVWLLTIDVDLSLATIFGSGAVIGAAGWTVGLRVGRRLPARPTFRTPAPSPSIVAALVGGLTVVLLEGLFRAGRLAGLYEFDGWAFWVPKAKAIYYFGGLDHQFFHDLPGQSYPPLVPALEAATFHFMGSPDVVTLHLQFWFLLAGFVGAVIGLLSGRVPALLLWPPVLLVLVTPHVVGYALQPQADFLLDELVALGVLLVALWLMERDDWALWGATLVLAAAMLTKREGYVFAACIVAAALITDLGRGRASSLKLVIAGLVAVAATVPWRVVLAVRDLSGGGPEAGGTGLLSNLDRAWPSLRLALSALFDFHIWLVVLPLLVLVVILAFAGGERRLSIFAAFLCVLCLAGLTWSTWAFPSLPITKEPALNPIVRFSGGLVLSAASLVPLLLAGAAQARELR